MLLPAIALLSASLFAAGDESFLKKYCEACHQGSKPAGGFAVARVSEDSPRWSRVALRVRNMEMPPKGAPAPPLGERELFVKSVEASLHQQACEDGTVSAGPAPIRRMNRDHHAGLIVRSALPSDAETLADEFTVTIKKTRGPSPCSSSEPAPEG